MSIGPQLPPHILAQLNSNKSEDDDYEGPPLPPPSNDEGASSKSIGPALPTGPTLPEPPTNNADDDDDDDYGPALPPELLASRSQPRPSTSTSPPPKSDKPRRTIGPSFPTGPPDEDDDDDIGPKPLPVLARSEEDAHAEAIREFMAKEERRRQEVENAGKPKALKRDEWMLAPPQTSELLGTLDPKKLRQTKKTFSANTSSSRPSTIDNTLWTETPAEKAQRIADEVAGKRKRAANDDGASEKEILERRRKMEADEDIRRRVEEHNKSARAKTLLDEHASSIAKAPKKDEEPAGIWDHTRDMGLGGRLMDDKSRSRAIQDAKGLSDRFGGSKGGSWL
ncbi:hypothetical protein SISSUDRAFT_1069269 [Sistotremastrum suecicum HHB10207 ss-3]|uniref:DUF3752 domain-containing protein n=1 Tax=Sistotremastrum suecicum HHB10207 ss-3 TaxID=1314776 RepID=A0A166HM54_9AGAM|nr:hypothetical protein SISSUDRAFT_1069269 [Sistotremastrum suecicum HHB10207 ss-3]